jgi:hypothetical protein
MFKFSQISEDGYRTLCLPIYLSARGREQTYKQIDNLGTSLLSSDIKILVGVINDTIN